MLSNVHVEYVQLRALFVPFCIFELQLRWAKAFPEMLLAAMWASITVIVAVVVGVLLIYRYCSPSSTNMVYMYLLDDKSTLNGKVERQAAGWRFKPGLPLPPTVIASQPDIIDRGQWVLRMTRHVFEERHGRRHNVVVINKELEYYFEPAGVVERHDVKYYEPPNSRTVPYDVVVFREGVLHNMGDGGDINWDWMGNFTRQGTGMLSFKPCQEGRRYVQDPWVAAID